MYIWLTARLSELKKKNGEHCLNFCFKLKILCLILWEFVHKILGTMVKIVLYNSTLNNNLFQKL